jgi:glycosyltransferase involved in cell wall biosynthesis
LKKVPSKMRIGVMLRHYGQLGGIGVYTKNILHALFQIDQKNDYHLLFRHSEQLGDFNSYPNVIEHLLGAPNKLWWDQITVPLFARSKKLDLVYNPKLTVPIIGQFKKVFVMHGAEQFAVPHCFKWHDRIYFMTANPIYCKRADVIITDTHHGANDVANYMGADPAKIGVIYLAYNEMCQILMEDKTLKVREKYNLPEHFIFYIGGLNPVKNLGNLLKAYKTIKNTIPQKLVVSGFKRWRYSEDLDLIEQLGLAEDVWLTGFVPDEDIPSLYNLADLFVFPSLYEGFGMPVLEAMACGCPVVATKKGCTPEVTGDAAVLVDPYDPEEIAAGILVVLQDEELKSQLMAKGLRRIQEFSWEKCARETLELFESL